jgi:hypothetical protein
MNAHMLATGTVNDALVPCFRHQEDNELFTV